MLRALHLFPHFTRWFLENAVSVHDCAYKDWRVDMIGKLSPKIDP
jgi:hypothetical protein